MKKTRSNRLPTKQRMFLVVLVSIAGYAVLEGTGGFDFSSLAEPTRKLFGRAGIIIGYLSALIAGTSFYWDARAQMILERAEERKRQAEANLAILQKLQSELGNRFQAELKQCTRQIGEADTDMGEASTYLSTKSWLGWSALGGVVLGTLLQLIGAT